MALDFGKLEFSVSFNPTSAFPLDARSYFESLATAQIAAKTATEAGKADSAYYYGQTLAVVENGVATLYIIQPNKTLQAVGKIDSNLFIYNDKDQLTLKGLDTAPEGSVPIKNSEGGFDWVIPINAYSKSETDLKISEAIAAAPHLKRKIVKSIDEIDVNAAQADQYIYMVPTGLQEDSNKYYEYIVVIVVDAEGTETRFVEQVGSWDINLDNYATIDQLNTKVDKKDGYELIPSVELNKLLGIETGAQSNVINSVSSEFIIDVVNNRQLQLNSISVEKVIGLEDLLATKVDKKEGYSLVSPTDRDKLNALDFNGGDLVISGTVNANSVKDLNIWITEHSAPGENFVQGLSQNNLTNELYNKLMKSIYIASVNPDELAIDPVTHELYVLEIDSNKITGLQDALNEKANALTVQELDSKVTTIEAKFNNYVTQEKHNADLAAVWDILTWKNITE